MVVVDLTQHKLNTKAFRENLKAAIGSMVLLDYAFNYPGAVESDTLTDSIQQSNLITTVSEASKIIDEAIDEAAFEDADDGNDRDDDEGVGDEDED